MSQDTRRQMSTNPKAVQSVTFHPSWCETKVHRALCTERMAVCLLDGVWFLRWLNCFWLSYFWTSTFILASPMTLVGLSQWTDWKSAKPHRWDFSWVDPNVCGLSENQQKYFVSHFARLRFLLDCFDTHRIKALLLDADEHRQDCSSHCFTQKVDSGTLALGLAPGLRLALWLRLAVELNKHCLQTRREIQWEIALLLPCHCHQCCFYAIFKAL